jgi:hypothetical protein
MNDQRRAAFEAWAAQFDHFSDEYQDMGTDQYFIAGYQAAIESQEVQALRDALIESDNQLKQFLPLIDGGIIHADDDFHWCLTRNRAALAAMEKQK